MELAHQYVGRSDCALRPSAPRAARTPALTEADSNVNGHLEPGTLDQILAQITASWRRC
jgi:hypothetical protein